MSSFTEFLQPLTSAFNPQEVFASLTNFLGSGYMGVAVVAILVWGLVKKVTKLLVYAGVGLVVWYLCTSGKADEVIQIIQQSISGLF